MSHLLLLEDDLSINKYLSELISKSFNLLESFTYLTTAKHYCSNNLIDLAIIDIGLPDGSGFELVEYLTVMQPSAKKLVFTIFDDSEFFLKCVRYGIDGYILKDAEEVDILDTISKTLNGHSYISPKMARYLLDSEKTISNKAYQSNYFNLTPREKDVLRLICIGHSYSDIASQLNLQLSTVSSYVKSLYSKMNVKSKNEAAYKVFKHGAITVD